MNRTIILASSSKNRAVLLRRLDIAFQAISPDIDESPLAHETPQDMVRRLAYQKTIAVAAAHVDEGADALIIGSDQVAMINGEILGKPGNHDNAVAQLKICSGKMVTFLTSLCLYNTATKHSQIDLIPSPVLFRKLKAEQLIAYVKKDQPFGAAGSFHAEGLGIVLVERFLGEDPSALIGLPLIRLCTMLAAEGVDILK